MTHEFLQMNFLHMNSLTVYYNCDWQLFDLFLMTFNVVYGVTASESKTEVRGHGPLVPAFGDI